MRNSPRRTEWTVGMAEIPQSLKQNLKQQLLDNLTPANSAPALYAMVGIPASGKTTFLNLQQAKNTLPPEHYYHNPDCIMTAIPGYQNDAVRKGLDYAREKWELPSREFADQLLFPEAVRKQLNIVMDMGMAREEIIEMVRSCVTEGYHLSLHIIYCPLHAALKRREQREHHVPESVVTERARFIADNIDRILSLSEDAQAYNNEDLAHPFQPLSIEKARLLFRRDA